MSIDTNALLPCPFCGGSNIGLWHVETHSLDSSYDVFGCMDCCATFEDGGPDDWNQRAGDDRLAVIERLAETGTAQAFGALSDDDKLRWWIVTGQRDKEIRDRLAALEESNTLLSASMKQQDAQIDEMEAENGRLRGLLIEHTVEWYDGHDLHPGKSLYVCDICKAGHEGSPYLVRHADHCALAAGGKEC